MTGSADRMSLASQRWTFRFTGRKIIDMERGSGGEGARYSPLITPRRIYKIDFLWVLFWSRFSSRFSDDLCTEFYLFSQETNMFSKSKIESKSGQNMIENPPRKTCVFEHIAV